MSIRVHDLAHSRAGDKGDRINISVIAYDEAGFSHLGKHLNCERVMQTFGPLAHGPCLRFELPKLRAYNFVIDRALDGGVTRSMRMDIHGKSLSSLMLTIELPDMAPGAP